MIAALFQLFIDRWYILSPRKIACFLHVQRGEPWVPEFREAMTHLTNLRYLYLDHTGPWSNYRWTEKAAPLVQQSTYCIVEV